MSLKIIFEYPHPLPVKTYGGIERMMYWHMKEMVRQGHRPVLIGHPESSVEKDGIELIPKHDDKWWEYIPKDADGLMMFHNDPPPVDLPTIYNIGGNGKPGELFPKNTIFVSRKHAENHGSDQYIYNAIDLSQSKLESEKLKACHKGLPNSKETYSYLRWSLL